MKNRMTAIVAVGVLGATAFCVSPVRACADGSCATKTAQNEARDDLKMAPDGMVDTTPAANGKVSPRTAAEIDRWLAKLREEADAAFHKGDYPKAIQKLKTVVVIEPTDFDAFGTGAWLMWSLGNGDEATAFMRRGVAGDAKNWEMWEEAGAHFTLRKILPEETQRDFERALELAPKNADTRLLRHRIAFAREGNGQLANAVEMWQEIVREFPDDAVAIRKLKETSAKVVASTQSSTRTSNTRASAA